MLQVAQMAGQDGPLAGHAVHAAKTSPHAAVPVGLRLKQVAPPQHGTPRTLAWKWRRSMPLLTAASRRHLSAGSAKTGQQGGELCLVGGQRNGKMLHDSTDQTASRSRLPRGHTAETRCL